MVNTRSAARKMAEVQEHELTSSDRRATNESSETETLPNSEEQIESVRRQDTSEPFEDPMVQHRRLPQVQRKKTFSRVVEGDGDEAFGGLNFSSSSIESGSDDGTTETTIQLAQLDLADERKQTRMNWVRAVKGVNVRVSPEADETTREAIVRFVTNNRNEEAAKKKFGRWVETGDDRKTRYNNNRTRRRYATQ